KKSLRRVGNNWRMKMLTRRTTDHRYIIIDAQCDTKTIKARTEVGSARRNANGYLLHRGPAAAEMRATMHRLCGSLAMQPRAATDPLRDGDSKYAIGAIKEHEFRLDQSRLASGFSGRGNQCAPALHHRGWLGGALRPGHPHFVQTSAGPGAASL